MLSSYSGNFGSFYCAMMPVKHKPVQEREKGDNSWCWTDSQYWVVRWTGKSRHADTDITKAYCKVFVNALHKLNHFSISVFEWLFRHNGTSLPITFGFKRNWIVTAQQTESELRETVNRSRERMNHYWLCGLRLPTQTACDGSGPGLDDGERWWASSGHGVVVVTEESERNGSISNEWTD